MRRHPGTFYVDASEPGLSGAVADLVYVRLSDSSDPSSTNVMLILAFYVGTCGVTLPVLGPNKLVDGGLEAWTTATNLTNWTEETIGAGGETRPRKRRRSCSWDRTPCASTGC